MLGQKLFRVGCDSKTEKTCMLAQDQSEACKCPCRATKKQAGELCQVAVFEKSNGVVGHSPIGQFHSVQSDGVLFPLIPTSV